MGKTNTTLGSDRQLDVRSLFCWGVVGGVVPARPSEKRIPATIRKAQKAVSCALSLPPSSPAPPT
ncbi:MAG: hypothetical protein LRZ84_22910, partial [Desertifilum sp.]|nr:hypothetical protein [Desertifilum sp.]